MKGIFITFEGSEGTGKSTQSKLLYGYLRKKGYRVIYLREPGGTKISEKIRKILLDPKNKVMTPATELLLYMASRAQMVREVVQPALRQGKIVLCDRFLDSTLAYQGFGLGINIEFIKYLGGFVTLGISPALTIFLDLPVKKALWAKGKVKDRIEKRNISYHLAVRSGYLKLARREPWRIKIVRVEKDKTLTQEKIKRLAQGVIKRNVV